MAEKAVHTGKCHCGAVSYRAAGLAEIWYCHCRQCRSLTGHYMAACRTARDDISIDGEIAWTPVSDKASHGFCARCHAPLFWKDESRPTMSVIMGSLDDARGIVPAGHIFVSEKAAYYEITDGLPQFATWPQSGSAGVDAAVRNKSCS